jgi:uncharacterized protein (TIGR02145 family)
MNKKIFFYLFAIVAVLSVALVSCKEEEAMKPTIRLSAEKVTLLVGEDAMLSVESGAANDKVRWVSSDRFVASVDNAGKVSALGLGEATISAVTPDGVSGFCYVSVICYVDSIEAPAHDTMIVYEKHKLDIVVHPKVATDQSLAWSSSNENVATVDSTGEIIGVGLGDVVITARTSFTAGDDDVVASCSLHVRYQYMDSVVLNIDTVRTLIKGRIYQLTATMYPANPTNKKISWTSDNPGVATVDSTGLVRPVNAGTASITATTDDGGHTAVAGVKVLNSYPTLKVGTTEWAATNVYWGGKDTRDHRAAMRPDTLTTLYQYGAGTGSWSADGLPGIAQLPPPAANNQCGIALGTGWRYPTADEFNALATIMSPDTASMWAAAGSARGNAVAGRFFSVADSKRLYKTCSFDNLEGCIFIPAMGYKNETAGTLQEQGVKGYYWSSSAFGFNTPFYSGLSFDGTPAEPQINPVNRLSAYGIRCVRTVTP